MDVIILPLRDIPLDSWVEMQDLSSAGTVHQYLIEEYGAEMGPILEPEPKHLIRTMQFKDKDSYSRFYLKWM